MKKLLVLTFLSIWIISPQAFAQGKQKFTLEGKITLYGTEEPIPYANVLIKELNVWGTSDVNGVFKVTGIIPGTYTLESSCLGYQKVSFPITVTRNIKDFKIQLKEENLTLDDVVVTATVGGTLNSSSRIDKSAIEHVQASSLAGIMQLVPGNVTVNPSLTSANGVTIRTIGGITTGTGGDINGNNQRGVGLMINGARISADAKISKIGSTSLTEQIDFRNFSTENIESVEVLKGVLSAEYGDVTSGAIIVKTKTGHTPYEVRVKTDPHTKAIALGKGFSLGEKAGTLNIDADYARAFSDWASPVDIFDRTTLNLTYSNIFNTSKTPLKFNASVNGFISGNNTEADPDVSSLDFSKYRSKNLTVSLFGSWMLNKSWISSLDYNLSGSYEKDTERDYVVSSQLPLPSTITKTEGITIGYFTSATDPRDRRAEDIPIYLNAKFTGNLNKRFGEDILSKTKIGLEVSTKGNEGRGEYYTSNPPQYFRGRKYSDIPYMTDLNLFIEEKLPVPVGKTSFELSAGGRFTKMFIEGYDYDPTIDPRFNAKYKIIDKRKKEGVLRSLAIRGGWGIMQKLPSISILYPAPSYLDNCLFQYRNSSTGESLAVIQTSVIDERLPYNLEPAKTRNAELGIDFNILGVDAQITYFNESLTNGISSNHFYVPQTYDYYNTVTSQTASPKFENGRVWVKNEQGVYEQLGYKTKTEYKSYSRPDNRAKSNKWGIEYDINFGKISSINTSVIVNGAYIRTENEYDGLFYSYTGYSDPIVPSQKIEYVPIWSGDDLMTKGTGRERFSTNISLITHIPSIRMIISLVTQCIWVYNTWNLFDEGNIYSIDENGNRVFGDYSNQNNTVILYRDPLYYMDFAGNIRPFSDYYTTTDQNLKTRLGMLRKATDLSYYFNKQGYNPFFMANIRVTKEIGKLASLSFYANNFTNSTPIMKDKARPNAVGTRVNPGIYFGAELKLTF